MLQDLGKYAFAVLSSYGATAVLLIGLIVFVVMRNAKARKTLEIIENEVKNGRS